MESGFGTKATTGKGVNGIPDHQTETESLGQKVP